jgi:hypothetical protein
MAARHGSDTAALDWHKRLVCSACGSRESTSSSPVHGVNFFQKSVALSETQTSF